MGYIKFLFLAIVSIILVAFCAANRGAVSLSLFPLPYIIELPVFIFALLCIALGVVLGSVALNIKLLQTKLQLRKSKIYSKAVDNENKILRSEHEHASRVAISHK